MHLPRSLACLRQRERLGNHRINHSLGNQTIGFVCLSIVGEVRTHQSLETHPKETVVELQHESTRGSTRHHRATLFHHVHRRTKSAAPWMLEHDVGILADKRANVATKSTPLTFVMGVVVVPELVVGLRAINDRLTAHLAQNSLLVRRAHHANGDATAVQHVLHGVCADSAGCTPNEHHITLLHACTVLRHQHAITRAVAQCVHRGFFPRQVRWLGHQLIRLHHGEIGQATEVGFVTPDALVGAQHRVVVCAWVLIVDVIAMDGHSVPGLPVANRGADSQHHSRTIASQDVIRQVMPLCPRTLACQSGECTKRTDWFKDCAPHGVEVDAAGHHRHECFVGRQLRHRHLTQLDALARIFVARRHSSEHLLVLLLDDCRPIRARDRYGGELLARCPAVDGVTNGIHG